MWRSRANHRSDLMHFVMIKPSHYDDDGYPIQWFRSAIPSNTLACLNGLAEDAQRREVLGPGVEIRLHTYDETNRRVRPDRIIRDDPQGRRQGADRPGRRAVEPVSARGRSGAAVPRRRPAGLHRRLPRLRLHRHAAGAAAGHARGAGARHLALRRRSRGGPARRGAARRLERHAQAALQLHGQAAGAARASRRRSCRASTCGGPRARCRASISAAAAPISARSAPSSTCRAARAGSARPTISNGSCARTMRRASSASSSPTTILRATRDWEMLFDRLIHLRDDGVPQDRLHHPGRHAVPQDSELHREGGAGRRAPRLHRA